MLISDLLTSLCVRVCEVETDNVYNLQELSVCKNTFYFTMSFIYTYIALMSLCVCVCECLRECGVYERRRESV